MVPKTLETQVKVKSFGRRSRAALSESWSSVPSVPGNQVGVMFHLCQNDDITWFQVSPSPRLRNQVDGLCRVACENQLPRVLHADETRYPAPGTFIRRGCFFSKRVHTAVNVGIHASIVLIHSQNYTLWFLRCRS